MSGKVLVINLDDNDSLIHHLISCIKWLNHYNTNIIDTKNLITLDNKYYQVELEFIQLYQLVNLDLDNVQAILMVYCDDETDENEKVNILEKIELLKTTNKLFAKVDQDALLKMCLACKHHDDSKLKEVDEDLLNYCYEHQIEYLDIDIHDPLLTNDIREKDNIARILEAMSGIMWVNMKMKNEKTILISEEEVINISDDNKTTTIQDEKIITETEGDNIISETIITTEETINNDLFEHQEDDGDVFEFENLIKEVQSMKQEIKNLPDEERRKKASDFILKMMQGIDEDI